MCGANSEQSYHFLLSIFVLHKVCLVISRQYELNVISFSTLATKKIAQLV